MDGGLNGPAATGFRGNTSAAMLISLQRSAGNLAVARQLTRHGSHLVGPRPGSFPVVQRCGPNPCNCSDDERADYAATHSDDDSQQDSAEDAEHRAPVDGDASGGR
jgi:hypothetical protein